MNKVFQLFSKKATYFLLGAYTWILSLHFFDFLPPQDLPVGSEMPARVIFDYNFKIFSELFLLGGLFVLAGVVLLIWERVFKSRGSK